jgi:1,4-dihydroxy-2-naphthoyl-CoA hydrolase
MVVDPGTDAEPSGFDGLYGLSVSDCSAEIVRGTVEVGDELRQSNGFVHGGVYAAIADALAVAGTSASVAPEGKVAVGFANHTAVLHPIADGTIHATATRRHRGRTTWVWDIEISDRDGRTCVAGRVTVAVRDR